MSSKIETMIGAMSLEEKISLISGKNWFYTKPIPSQKIPSLRMVDGPVGVRRNLPTADGGWRSFPTVSYPASICTAATWDEELAKRVGAALAQDCKDRHAQILLAPGVNMCRSSLCGRTFEYLGEDPCLASKIAVAFIKGVQGQGIVATVKHMLGNNQEWNRHYVSSDIAERTLREIYLPVFEAAIKEGQVGAIMTSYNLISGEYASECRRINQIIIKDEFGFQGLIMSDWISTYDTVKVANGGVDLEMPSDAVLSVEKVKSAIKAGTVLEATIDEKVRRILRTMDRFGFLSVQPSIAPPEKPIDNPEGRKVAYEVACNGIVLLKNEGLLPFDGSKIKTLAVIGPIANQRIPQGGGSSKVEPLNCISFLDGIRSVVSEDTKIVYARGVPDFCSLDSCFSLPHAGSSGLQGEYFDNPDFAGAPLLLRNDQNIAFTWREGSFCEKGPVNDYSIRWSGYFAYPQDQDVTFYMAGYHKFRVFLDEQLIIDRWNATGETLQWNTVHITGNQKYAVRVECSVGKSSQAIDFGVCMGKVDHYLLEAKEAASKADAVVVCVGFDERLETEDMDKSFTLPYAQNTLIQAVCSVNAQVATVVTSGGNVDMSSWVDKTPAILHTWFPGQEGGLSLARILFGEVNPSGKLPISFEKRFVDNPVYSSYYGQKSVSYSEGVFMGYRGYDKSGIQPQFPFGHGLSYTTFQFSNLHVESTEGHPPVQVSFDIENTGSREGAQVGQVYVSELEPEVARPKKELKAFKKVLLKSHEKQTLALSLDARAFSYYDVTRHGWKMKPGRFEILVNTSAVKTELKQKISFT